MQTAILCSICKSDQTVTDPESGEIICRNCGLVLSDKAQESRPEWRAFTGEEANDRSRTGIPSSLARHDMGLSTVIGRTDKDASGRAIDVAMRSTMGRLRAWDFRTQAHSPTDRNLRQAFSELDRLKDKLGVSDAVIEKTAYIYRKAQERGLVRGRTISAMVGAALYIACRETGASRTLKDIAEIGNIKRKDLARIYRLVVMELDLKIPMIDPMKCIVRVANRANLSERTKRVAMNIMKGVTKSGISAGKDPMGLAASVLYLACLNTGESRTQTDIAEAAGVTEVTVRNRYKNLKSQLDLN
ncbi:transcription initiation factor IIB [Candidatus Nitrososphaera gargensis]|uniref:transcription initiation factor IIB n=1 Tax=Candidatus Nitrososphaera gargensis TaxID=497727 RepID=UPI0011E58034|nr:TFIIB-type zinc ribbon-containing protein [Candidatus Nitrososphaera gargensis]